MSLEEYEHIAGRNPRLYKPVLGRASLTAPPTKQPSNDTGSQFLELFFSGKNEPLPLPVQKQPASVIAAQQVILPTNAGVDPKKKLLEQQMAEAEYRKKLGLSQRA